MSSSAERRRKVPDGRTDGRSRGAKGNRRDSTGFFFFFMYFFSPPQRIHKRTRVPGAYEIRRRQTTVVRGSDTGEITLGLNGTRPSDVSAAKYLRRDRVGKKKKKKNGHYDRDLRRHGVLRVLYVRRTRARTLVALCIRSTERKSLRPKTLLA